MSVIVGVSEGLTDIDGFTEGVSVEVEVTDELIEGVRESLGVRDELDVTDCVSV